MSEAWRYNPAKQLEADVRAEQAYRIAIGERLKVTDGLLSRFAMEALRRGVAEANLPEVVAAAMKEGVVPAVVTENGFARTRPYRPVFLSGDIPGSALTVELVQWRHGGDYSAYLQSTDPYDEYGGRRDDVYDIAAASEGAFVATGEEALVREHGVQEARTLVLAGLDQVIAQFGSAPEQT